MYLYIDRYTKFLYPDVMKPSGERLSQQSQVHDRASTRVGVLSFI